MRLLLDTHALIWWLEGSSRLSPSARQAMENEEHDVLTSAATAWEITTKHRLGKLPGADLIAADVAGAIADQGFGELAITMDDAARAGALPGPHRDPFDGGRLGGIAARLGGERCPSGSLRHGRAVFPTIHGREGDAEPIRELLLRQVEAGANGVQCRCNRFCHV